MAKRHLYKDYYIEDGVLCKDKIKESVHLMWCFGGVPCIDADRVWDRYKDNITSIKIATDKGNIYEVDKETFDSKKELFNKGFGNQYCINKEDWKIICPQKYYQK